MISQIKQSYNKYLEDIYRNLYRNILNTQKIGQLGYREKCVIPLFEHPQEIVNAFITFSSSVFLPASANSNNIFHYNYDCINFTPNEQHEVKNVTLKFKVKLAAGPGKIPSFLVRDWVSCFVLVSTKIFKLCLNPRTFPDINVV